MLKGHKTKFTTATKESTVFIDLYTPMGFNLVTTLFIASYYKCKSRAHLTIIFSITSGILTILIY